MSEDVQAFGPLRDETDFDRFIGSFTNYERMKEYRYDAASLSLDRMRGLVAEIGSPDRSFPAVHIAGTKGKGTTSLILEALLSASGLSAGTYTSPHIERLTERIRLRGAPIGAEDLCALTRSILPVLQARRERGPAAFPTFFELMTALAMLHFRDRRADWGIFEVGLGGRLDATNVLRPRWTSITSIGLEHTDKLGDTVEAIAGEKAGIVKPGTPLVLGAILPAAAAVIRRVARERGAPVIEADLGCVRPAGTGLLEVTRPEFPMGSGPVPAGAIRGPGLREDLGIALEIWMGILAAAGRVPRPDELRGALTALRLPARIEVIEGPQAAVIDGAHTPESVRALARALEEIRFPRPRALVLALAADKPAPPILREIAGLAGEYFFTRADAARGQDPAGLAEEFRAIEPAPAWAIDDPAECLRRARAGGRAVVVTGSFYLAGRLRSHILNRR